MVQKAQMLQELFHQGMGLLHAGDAQAASFSFEAARKIAPRDFDILHMLGIAYSASGRHTEAEPLLRRATEINPTSAQAHLNYGIVLKALDKSALALNHQQRAVKLAPGDPGMYYNLGNTLRDLGRGEEAIEAFEQVLRIQPDNQNALNNLGNLCNEMGRIREAAHCVQRLLECGSDLPYLQGNLRHLKSQYCDWDNFEEDCTRIFDGVRQGLPVATPFSLLSLPSDALLQKHCAEISLSASTPIRPASLCRNGNTSHDRLRIAYFSSDFRQHATSYLVAEMLEKHDRTQFEVFAFSLGDPRPCPMRDRISAGVEHFLDVSEMESADIARLACQHEIDIAIDLNGHTKSAQTEIFAHRCAPIQINYLGYPGTMGADFMDYIVADPVLIPPGAENGYTEKVLRLPGTYQPNDSQRCVAAGIPSRSDLGLPEHGFVFCCFNNNFKITPDIFAIWMQLLKRIEGSVLWLFEDTPEAAAQLRHHATRLDVDPQRLVFAGRVPQPEHLARQKQADLFLDTLYYNAHTTASDALWVGLPVLTCPGQTFASRVAASLLTAAGVEELICQDTDDYLRKAESFARDPAALQNIRQHLELNRQTCSLFDSAFYTRNMESALAQVWQRHLQGLPPSHLDV